MMNAWWKKLAGLLLGDEPGAHPGEEATRNPIDWGSPKPAAWVPSLADTPEDDSAKDSPGHATTAPEDTGGESALDGPGRGAPAETTLGEPIVDGCSETPPPAPACPTREPEESIPLAETLAEAPTEEPPVTTEKLIEAIESGLAPLTNQSERIEDTTACVAREIGNHSQQLAELVSGCKQVSRELSTVAGRVEQVDQTTAGLSTELHDVRSFISQAHTRLDSMDRSLSDVSAGAGQSRDSIEHAYTRLGSIEELLADIRATLGQSRESAEQTQARLDEMDQTLATFGAETGRARESMKQVQEQMVAIRQRTDAQAAWSERTQNALERLARWEESHEGRLSSLAEQTEETTGAVQRIREIVAALPEIATGQTDVLDALQERMTAIESRSAHTHEAIVKLHAAAEETKSLLAGLNRSIGTCQQTNMDLAATQKRVVEVVNALNKRTAQLVEHAKRTSQTLQELAEGNQSLKDEVGEQIGKAVGGLATKSTISLVLSAIAAIAALAAAASAFLR